MDITDMLEHDHREAEQLFEKISSAGAPERRPLWGELRRTLDMHMRIEERHVYPLVRESIGDQAANEARNEHDEARRGLDEAERFLPDQPGFEAALEVVRSAIEHHIDEEETEVLPQLRERVPGERLTEIAATARQMKAEAPAQRAEAPPHEPPTALREEAAPFDASGPPASRRPAELDGMKKEELYEQAKAAGIKGRGSMTKAQL